MSIGKQAKTKAHTKHEKPEAHWEDCATHVFVEVTEAKAAEEATPKRAEPGIKAAAKNEKNVEVSLGKPARRKAHRKQEKPKAQWEDCATHVFVEVTKSTIS